MYIFGSIFKAFLATMLGSFCEPKSYGNSQEFGPNFGSDFEDILDPPRLSKMDPKAFAKKQRNFQQAFRSHFGRILSPFPSLSESPFGYFFHFQGRSFSCTGSSNSRVRASPHPPLRMHRKSPAFRDRSSAAFSWDGCQGAPKACQNGPKNESKHRLKNDI